MKINKFLMMITFMAVIFSSFAWAEKIQLTKDTIIRSEVMATDKVGVAKTGDTFDVLDVEGAWHYIEIVEGSKHIGAKGWIWRKLVNGKVILGKGAVLHKESSTGSEALYKILGGASYKLIKKQVKWYKISSGWIYYYNCKKLE